MNALRLKAAHQQRWIRRAYVRGLVIGLGVPMLSIIYVSIFVEPEKVTPLIGFLLLGLWLVLMIGGYMYGRYCIDKAFREYEQAPWGLDTHRRHDRGNSQSRSDSHNE